MFTHEYFMKLALTEAKKAFEEDEVPVGCVIVYNNTVIAKAHNLSEKLNDPTAHAEMMAITAACEKIGSKYLNECIMYVTLEPCTMCAGAGMWSKLGALVFGAYDEKRGYRNHENILHEKTQVVGGILENECSELLKLYFKNKRD